ncbi:MAG: LPS export ABC transporter periplasmic protein LptC, partial [Candidatus Binatia bacterium]
LGGVAYKVAEHLWLMKAREIQRNPLQLLDYAPETTLRIKDFRRTKVEGGRKVWEVFGEEARYLKAEKEAVIEKPRIIFYDKKGETIEATGNEGHLSFTDQGQEMERMQLRGGVQVSYQGFVLRTDEALYDKSKNQLVLPGRVTVKGDGLELEGVGMEIALQEEKIRLLQRVRTKLQPELLGNRRGRTNEKNG